MGSTGTSAAKKSSTRMRVPQLAGEKRFASVVQLLEVRGERLVRFAYSTDGPAGRTARRGPVTLRARDVERLRAELAKHPELADALGLGGGSDGDNPERGEA